MKNHIITSSNIQNHKVENYRFKVLLDDRVANEPQAVSQDSVDDVAHEENFVPQENETLENENTAALDVAPAQPQPKQNNFVHEEMLKKIETLSENVIKLQMQIESNEQEFQKRLESEINTAKENAYNEGKNDAKKNYDIEIEKLNEKLLKSVEKLDKKVLELDTFLNKTESELSGFAVDIAQEVIALELSENSSKIAYALSKEIIKDLRKDVKIKISVNPKDFSYIKEKYPENNFTILADDAINSGCVMVLSDELNVDANIKDRLNKVKNMVLKD